MTKLINKMLILFCCLFVYVMFNDSVYMVAPVIIAVIMSALESFFDIPAFRVAGIIIFSGLCLLFPGFIFFAPLLLYDVLMETYAPAGFVVLLPAAAKFSSMPWKIYLFLLPLTCIAYLIKYYAVRLDSLKTVYIKLQDDTKEFAYTQEQKNKELMEKQDYEINLATLNERNRIAREIHDSAGHVMSSAILQVGALSATVKDADVKESLQNLKYTLAGGMDSIRNSVHDLHADSIDLNSQLYSLARAFTFCSLAYEYDVESSPELKIKYSVIAIVKEALSNIIRHSDATAAALTLRELPGFYQLIVFDNGSPKEYDKEKGMGIRNISSRVESLDGNLNIDNSKGFRLFISIPKGVKS